VCTLLAALVLLIYPAQRQARRDNRNIPWATRQSLALIVRSVQYTDLSNRLYRMGRDRDAVDAAQQASDLHPDSADAYLNLAASCAAAGKWDEAIQYSEEAVRLRPDWPLAKSNLDWTIREKKKASK
jgi:tetratricopeptide (TPR) repeat protein